MAGESMLWAAIFGVAAVVDWVWFRGGLVPILVLGLVFMLLIAGLQKLGG